MKGVSSETGHGLLCFDVEPLDYATEDGEGMLKKGVIERGVGCGGIPP